MIIDWERFFVGALISCGLVYAAGSFIVMDLDPTNWSIDIRAILTVFWVLFNLFWNSICDDEDKNERD